MRYLTASIMAFILAALTLQTPQAQIAQTSQPQNWNICNQTSYVLKIASAFIREGRMQASGWKDLNPGACLSETPPIDTPRFLYAQSAALHQGDIREWAGTVELCAEEADFLISAATDCKMQGLGHRKYLAVDPAEARTDLIEPSEFGDKAQTAGLQRLLKDAGYKISRIDGVSGRRTTRTIAAFKKDKSLEKNISDDALFSALIEAAKTHKSSIGLEICNDSAARIWSAIATRRQGGWQSRGWWDIEPERCVRPFNAPLDGTEMHVFALQENVDESGTPLPDRHLRTISTIPSQFCIGEAKFSAIGREFCTENGYNIANFRPVSTDNDGAKISLTDEDFAELNPTGLRR